MGTGLNILLTSLCYSLTDYKKKGVQAYLFYFLDRTLPIRYFNSLPFNFLMLTESNDMAFREMSYHRGVQI